MRDGRIAESAALAGLLSQLGHDVPAAWLASWMKAMNRGTDRVLVAEEDGKPVGVGVLHITPFLHEAGLRARLTALVVDRQARSRGIGTLLLNACEEAAIQMGCPALEGVQANGEGRHGGAVIQALGGQVLVEQLQRRLGEGDQIADCHAPGQVRGYLEMPSFRTRSAMYTSST